MGNFIELIEKLLQRYLYQQPYIHIQQTHPKHTSSTALTPQETISDRKQLKPDNRVTSQNRTQP